MHELDVTAMWCQRVTRVPLNTDTFCAASMPGVVGIRQRRSDD